MSTALPRRGWSSESLFCVILFVIAAAVHLCLASIGWNNTLLGPHSFRQAQTAITTTLSAEDNRLKSLRGSVTTPPSFLAVDQPASKPRRRAN